MDPSTSGPSSLRPFPLMFFNSSLVAVAPPADLQRQSWRVHADTSADPMLRVAVAGADRMLILGAVASGALALGLVLCVRAARASGRLAELRSEFVSGVTHELKTPIATIRAVGETLVSDRIDSPSMRREYAALVVQEVKRLTRLIDNLLVFSRITDVRAVYPFEPMTLATLVDEALRRFALAIAGAGFEVTVNVSPELPRILGDPSAIELMLDNLVDNVLRHARQGRRLEVTARRSGRFVLLEFTDCGDGIPQDEIGQVTRKFYRGRQAGPGGTGLGLAIATRIANDHGGRLTLSSAVGLGTTVSIVFPALNPEGEASPSMPSRQNRVQQATFDA
jgi:two-component system phosphate regulon sensor histidine kinase PhoR